MPDEYEKYNKMAEWIVARSTTVTPEYVAEKLNEATDTIELYLQGGERINALAKRREARIWLEQEAEWTGYVSDEPVVPVYPEWIMNKVRQSLGLEPGDMTRDGEINNMSHHEVFKRCLEWEGIIGYDYTLRGWVNDIYGIMLE